MRIEYYERGSGATRKRYGRKISENEADMIELWQEDDPTLEEQLKSVMEFWGRRLRENGFPDTLHVLNGAKEQWIDDHVIGQPGQDEDTIAGYAARIMRHAHNAQQPSTRKYEDAFAHYIFQIGLLQGEASVKFSKEGKCGEQQLKYLDIGRAESAKSRAAKRDEIAADFVCEATAIRQRNSHITCHAVAILMHDRRKNKNSKSTDDNQLPNQSVRRIRDKIKHLWE